MSSGPHSNADAQTDAYLRAAAPMLSDAGGADCPDEAELVAYRAGALDEAGEGALEGHLAECRDCRDLLAELARPVSAESRERALAVLPRRAAWRSAWVGGAAVLAMAAGLLLMVLPEERSATLPPAFAMEGPLGGVKAIRSEGAAPGVPRFLPETRLKLLLRPEAALGERQVQLALFWSLEDGPLRAAPPGVLERGQGGAHRVDVPAARLLGEAHGRVTLHVAIAEDAALFEGLVGQAPATAQRRTELRWLEAPLLYEPRPEAPR